MDEIKEGVWRRERGLHTDVDIILDKRGDNGTRSLRKWEGKRTKGQKQLAIIRGKVRRGGQEGKEKSKGQS